MQITLYYAPIACSLVPYVALTEAGAEFDRVSERASVQKVLAFESKILNASA